MKHENLSSFLETLKREGELHVIEEPTDPYLELAEIHRRVVARQGPGLLFTRVKGASFPLVTNLFGSRRRILLAFSEEPERLLKRMVEAAHRLLPPQLSHIWEFRDLAKNVLQLGSQAKKTGPVVERMQHPPRLLSLPQIQAWPGDGGAFLTLPLVYTENPITGRSNIGMYRNQIYDDRTLGMHFQIHRGIGFHYYEAERGNKALDANLFLGGPPALTMAAIAPLPENIPELVFASFLMQGRIARIRNPHISPLPVAGGAGS